MIPGPVVRPISGSQDLGSVNVYLKSALALLWSVARLLYAERATSRQAYKLDRLQAVMV